MIVPWRTEQRQHVNSLDADIPLELQTVGFTLASSVVPAMFFIPRKTAIKGLPRDIPSQDDGDMYSTSQSILCNFSISSILPETLSLRVI